MFILYVPIYMETLNKYNTEKERWYFMKKITFGTPEEFVPTKFCKGLSYNESPINYDISKITYKKTKRGSLVEVILDEDEEVFGFGLQLKGFNHKGHRLRLAVNSDPTSYTGDSHAPVPFFVTNKGIGIYFDTARYAEVYCGFAKLQQRDEDIASNKMITDTERLYAKASADGSSVLSCEIPSANGIDVYVFEGENILDVISQYNMFSGGGCSVPDWGLGVMYRAYTKYTGDEIKKLADYFRENDIPCDIIGLEPGWQTASYSCSYVWEKERYPDSDDVIQYLKSKNIHINLWEHAFVSSVSPLYKKLFDYSGNYEVWRGLVPDFSIDEARKTFADYHKETFVSKGIDGFKLDECDSGDFLSCWSFPNCAEFPSGMDGEQYHSLFGVLYMQTMMEALGSTPTLSQVRSAGALCASYPFVLYSDLYDQKDFIHGVVNSGFSGLLWSPEVRDAKTKKEFIRRLQVNVFSAQCLINGWYLESLPWDDLDCRKETKELLKTRKALLPLLRKAFDEYKETGKPPIRALVADYTADPETYVIDDEYIFCDKLIVAPLTSESDERKVYLPKGNWVDYWTKEPVSAGWFEVETENIPVYEKLD